MPGSKAIAFALASSRHSVRCVVRLYFIRNRKSVAAVPANERLGKDEFSTIGAVLERSSFLRITAVYQALAAAVLSSASPSLSPPRIDERTASQ